MKTVLLLLSIILFGQQTTIVSTEEEAAYQSASYHSVSTDATLPYYFIEPQSEPTAIFIYMHGAGGKYEQGMSDDLFAGNFKNLKGVLKEKGYLYVTPETSDFEKEGAQELVDLVVELKKNYGDLPVYLSGASAGGRTVFNALQEAAKQGVDLKGVILVCPALSEKSIQAFEVKSEPLPVWMEVGEKDTVMPPERAKLLEEKLDGLGYVTHLETIQNGDHNAPVEQMDWKKGIDFLINNQH